MITATTTCTTCHGTGWDAAFEADCYCGTPRNSAPASYADVNVAKVEAARFNDADLASWLSEQTWSDFAQSLARAFRKYGSLTPKQRAAGQSMRTKCEARAAVVAPIAASAEPVRVGMYRLADGAIAKVQQSRGSDRLYASLLTEDGFEYVAGLIRRIDGTMRLTLEEAKAYGHQTGRCCVCAAELTNPDSIAAGIGPICASRF